MDSQLRSAGPAKGDALALWALSSLLLTTVSSNSNLKIVGDAISYLAWLRSSFGSFRLLQTREALWKMMVSLMREGDWTVYEFGVAWGYTTQHWLKQDLPSIKQWHGFDRFTGLPSDWRDLKKGEFTAEGQTPPLVDKRLTWHVGDVEATLPKLDIATTKKCIFFDLDIYPPTAFACEYLRPSMACGDLLYFDELFDADEQRVLNENLLPYLDLELIACTPLAAVFRVSGVKEASIAQ